MDSAELLRAAIERKVGFIPGTPFYPCGGGANTLRLNFSNAAPEKIHEGIMRLGDVLHDKMALALLAG
jgi:2-aminoadipate transaminase